MRFLSYVSSKNTHFLSTSQLLVQMFSQYVPSHRPAGIPKSELHFRLVKKVDNNKFIYITMADFLAPKTMFA